MALPDSRGCSPSLLARPLMGTIVLLHSMIGYWYHRVLRLCVCALWLSSVGVGPPAGLKVVRACS